MWWICMCVCLVWAVRNGCSAVSVSPHFISLFVKTSKHPLQALNLPATEMYSVEVWWPDETITFERLSTGSFNDTCYFTNVLLMWIVSCSPGPVRSPCACIGVDWSRHKIITVTHWSNWPGPDQSSNRSTGPGSILWSEEVGAESRDAEKGGGMFCNVADQSGWTAVSGCVLVHLSHSLCCPV